MAEQLASKAAALLEAEASAPTAQKSTAPTFNIPRPHSYSLIVTSNKEIQVTWNHPAFVARLSILGFCPQADPLTT
ncbi:hypothetical protein IEQ34_006380 [Dendrobium chrysotoxum]|uniref:Uncharacterized protein n=1 Tax=Dendrobium chrysotoxum TaxID=161865 RepID=A0AAV7HEL5_DENCH|nr:hypothetical protein IEQ34_006380 [Dendrobium chrysotoxum]